MANTWADYGVEDLDREALERLSREATTAPAVGRGSWYSQAPGWVDRQDRPGSNALGVPDEQQGIALPSRTTLGQWFDVEFPGGQTHRLQQTDVGPAAWTGRGIDISAAAASRAGYTPRDFPTDAPFSWKPAEGPEPAKAAAKTIWSQYDEPAVGGEPASSTWAQYLQPQPAPAVAPAKAPAPPEAPGVLDYATEAAKQAGVGVAEAAVAAPLRGVAGVPVSEENLRLAGAIKAIQEGADIDVAARAAPLELEAPAESEFYQAGEAVSRAIGAKEPSKILHPVATDIARGFGSVAGSVVGAPLTLGAGPILGGMGESLQRAVEEGATPEQQLRAAQFGSIAGATDFADMLLVMGGGPGKALGLVKRVGLGVLKGAFIEGGQEAVQQTIQNAIAKGVYKPDQDITEDVLYSGAIGAIVGGTIRGAGAGLTRPEGKPGEVPRVEESVAGLTEPPTTEPVGALPGEKYPAPVDPEAALATTKPEEQQLPLPLAPAAPTARGAIVPPEGGVIFAEEAGAAPQPVFYSRLLQAAEQKLPNAGTAAQMLATLKNQSGVKQVEIDETGLEAFLNSRPGKVSKADIISHLEENQIKVEEVIHAKDISTGVVTPQDVPLQWEKFTAPGPVQSYTELRMTLPVDPKRLEFRDTTHWPDDPNVVGHARITTRIDKSGGLVAHIDEIQSTWNQLGNSIGFLTTEEAVQVHKLRQERNKNVKLLRAAHVISSRLSADRNAVRESVRLTGGVPSVMMQNRMAGLADSISRNTGVQRQLLSANEAIDSQLSKITAVVREGVEGREVKHKPPPSPFKTNWAELMSKRLYRWAADNGYSKITWANPELAMLWNTGAFGNLAEVKPSTQKFLTDLYGSIIPQNMKKIAKSYGGVMEKAEIRTGSRYDINLRATGYVVRDLRRGSIAGVFPTQAQAERQVDFLTKAGAAEVWGVTVPQTARTMIQRGMALFDEILGPKGGPAADVTTLPGVDAAIQGPFRKAVNDVVGAFNEYAKKFGFDGKIEVRLAANQAMVAGQLFANHRGVMWKRPDGKYEITMFMSMFRSNIAAFYTTLMHEFGHAIVEEHFENLPDATKQIIRQEFRDWRAARLKSGDLEDLMTTKRPAAVYWLMRGAREVRLGERISDLSQRYQEYQLSDDEGFHEYMADQVARWATTREEPLSMVEKAWAGIGKALRFFQEWMANKFGVETRASLTVQNWLDSFVSSAAPMSEQEYMRLDIRTQKANQYYVGVDSGDQNVSMPPQQPSTAAILGQIGGSGGENLTSDVKAAAAHADRITWLYKFAGSILDLVERNPNFTPLLRMVEKARDKDRMEREILDPHQSIAKAWQALGRRGSESLAAFLDDVTNMVYLTDDEKRRGVERHPSPAEIQTLARKHNVGREGLSVAVQVRRYLEGMLKLSSDQVRRAAMQINDPVVRAQRLDEINGEVARLLAKPYFPFMRFGSYYVLVRTAGGATRYFETFERKGLLSPQRQQQRKAEELRRSGLIQPDDDVKLGKLPETAQPFYGMPPHMLDLIKEKLKLTPDQLDALNQLRFQLSPAQSWRHFFQHKRYVPGYSQDFLRAFSRYAFHGARFIAKMEYVEGMRQDIRDSRSIRSNVTDRIADFMQDYLDNTILDVKGDYGLLKGLMFLWAMGYSPAAASLNLSQTPLVTFPYLATHFGYYGALKQMMSTIARFGSFYRRGTYEGLQEWEMKGISHGIREGRIVETQAPIIAAMSQGGLIGSGATAAARTGNWILEKSGVMFELMEQINRRVAFRAAMRLAYNKPHAKIVDEAVRRYPREYRELQQKWGHSELEARAIVAAGHITDRTQVVYAGWARPRMMRGRAGTILIFKRYLQHMLFLLGSDKKFFFNYALIMAVAGGLGGLPYAEDIKNIIQAVLRWMGYNADVEKELGKLVKQYTDGTIPPDLVLHGLARRGFGIPAALDALGSIYTGRPGRGLLNEDIMRPGVNVPYPQFDRSRAITSGPILPREVWQALDPSKEVGESIGGATNILGYGFSAMTNMLKAATDKHLAPTDLKRWEKAMPRALAGLSKMYRGMTELDPNAPGFTRERSGGPQSGSTVVRYNIRDPEQFMELLGVGMGYNDLRRSNEWNRIISQNEHIKFIDMKRQGLLESYKEAIKSSPQEAEAAMNKIKEFNAGLSDADKAKAIGPDTIKRSVGARERERIAREQNIPRIKSNIPIAREYQEMYPRTIEMIPR